MQVLFFYSFTFYLIYDCRAGYNPCCDNEALLTSDSRFVKMPQPQLGEILEIIDR